MLTLEQEANPSLEKHVSVPYYISANELHIKYFFHAFDATLSAALQMCQGV